ncbi:ABC transporter ATP-binding protein [Paractinoplanes lichenicola]|uniref:ABC transporter ATP-binding protein n=1 Tax=Paractinoplanes lichenicola TaxID=2802976 RepID=A0ABS1W059_9ACTN|nr:ABC transporter ATP-binding protein [Actinoplanes lichenicola]MBL7260132.1 ABC transporter ATP-binding protein [Actinoplanes lichenicola]
MTLLQARDLVTTFHTAGGPVEAVRDVSFDLDAGETLALVGESGSGKSVTALSLLNMVRPPGRIERGEVLLDGRDLLKLGEAEMRTVRGGELSMIFQDPVSSLNPLLKVRAQLTEAVLAHRRMPRRAAEQRAVELMTRVGIPDPEARLSDHPLAFSGGMAQRVMIAMALAGEPKVIIADEPTTALDVTIQAQILELLAELNRENGTAVILITHNLGIVARLCQRVAVMYKGEIVEQGTTDEIFTAPRHTYTKELLAATPSLRRPRPPMPAPEKPEPLLEVRELTKSYRSRGRTLQAVAGVSFEVGRGETVGLVGESGCGKSTIAKLVLGIEEPTSGHISYGGSPVTGLRGAAQRAYNSRVQLVFQNPMSSLNPRMTVGQAIGEPLRVRGSDTSRVAELLELVGLPASAAGRYPHEFSGGQRQRIVIARALAVEPELIVCDEAVAALDVSLQAQIIALLRDLQARLGLSYLFIGHDLASVRDVSARMLVMYLGEIVESGPSDEVTATPLHPYAASLLSSVPEPDPQVERERERIVLRGEVPTPLDPPPGCRFHTRCPIGPLARPGRTICRTDKPPLLQVSPGRAAACHFPGELKEDSCAH